MTERGIGRIWWALLAGVIALTLLFATGVAHAAVHPAWQTQQGASASCEGVSAWFTNTEPAGTSTDFDMLVTAGGVTKLAAEGGGTVTFDLPADLDGGSVRFDLAWDSRSGTDTRYAQYGAVEGSCEPVIDPKGSFDGPCGDPLYGISVDNSGSNVPVTFKLKFVNPIHGVQNRAIAVAAGDAGWWKGPVRKDPTYPSYGRWHVKAGTTLALRYIAGDEKGLIFKTATTRAHGTVCTLLEGWVGEQEA